MLFSVAGFQTYVGKEKKKRITNIEIIYIGIKLGTWIFKGTSGLSVTSLYWLLKTKEQSYQKVKDKEIWGSEVESDLCVVCLWFENYLVLPVCWLCPLS